MFALEYGCRHRLGVVLESSEPQAVQDYKVICVRRIDLAHTLQLLLRIAYQSDWRGFCSWCEGQNVCPLPAAPETVAGYVAECAGHLKPGSIQRRLNAIAEAHKAAGLEPPTHNAIVRNTMKGIHRTMGTAPAQEAPALTADIRTMVEAAGDGTIGTRDRALVLI